MTDRRPATGDAVRAGNRCVGDELAPSTAAIEAEQERVHARRAKASRSLATRRMRRRILPPLAAGSIGMLGIAATEGWVGASMHPAAIVRTAPPASERLARTNGDPAVANALAQDAAALDKAERSLAADEAAIASLAQVRSPSGKPGAGAAPDAGVAPGTGAAPGTGTAPGTGAAPYAGISVPALPSIAPLPAYTPPLAPAPSAAPSTHATTGATVVVP